MKKREKRQEEGNGESSGLSAMCVLCRAGAGGAWRLLRCCCAAVLVSAGMLPGAVDDREGAGACVVGAGRRAAGGAPLGRAACWSGWAWGSSCFLLLLTAGLLAYETAAPGAGGRPILCACSVRRGPGRRAGPAAPRKNAKDD
ncbi:MAG: hypothetical protein V8S34_08345 [Lawsonibacter sp.]